MKNNIRIPLFDVNLGREEQEAVKDVLQSGWLSMGPKVEQFEHEFAAHIGTHHAVAVSSCTAALHLSLHLAGISPGDEVLVPSLTFVATANAVRMVGATPVFVDIISPSDWTIDPQDAENKISPKTKAIIPMHYAGFMCEMSSLVKLAQKYNLAIIEDAAHAPYSLLGGKCAGTYGLCGCFSFYSNKNITTAEGGMLTTNDSTIADRARVLRSHGLTSTAYDRLHSTASYDVAEFGFNYRMSEINAAIGIVQLTKLIDDIHRRNQLVDYYQKQLQSITNIFIPFAEHPGSSSHYIFPVYLNNINRNKLQEYLKTQGIQTSVHYPPVHTLRHYHNPHTRLKLTENIASNCISLPLYSRLTLENIDYITSSLRSYRKIAV